MCAHLVLPSMAVCIFRAVVTGRSKPQRDMAKRIKSKPLERGSVLFDVVYEDGSQASNRRVPVEVLGGLDGDEPARDIIAAQDEVIAQKSGRPQRMIRTLTRSPLPEPKSFRDPHTNS
jgi:hypothetical protein